MQLLTEAVRSRNEAAKSLRDYISFSEFILTRNHKGIYFYRGTLLASKLGNISKTVMRDRLVGMVIQMEYKLKKKTLKAGSKMSMLTRVRDDMGLN